ncbi:unnamed protein product [Echinostoma caproni]|uniref:N-terminal peptide n=1 Tax=Echinostoma caproni TaxID=27848 RepID=A0A183A7E7_9TREM|nr:unnamed protein product [Echinostoma caproni]
MGRTKFPMNSCFVFHNAYTVAVILIVVCCCKRRAKKKAALEQQNEVLESDQFGIDSQLNDPWDSGEKDFMGPIDYTILQPNQQMRNSTSDVADGRLRKNYIPREHGQKTTDRPPWEQLEGQENPAMNLDQVLEYGYEGYDGKPPPDFCPAEPPTLIGADDDYPNSNDLIKMNGGFEPPTLSRMSNSRSEHFN